jgi:hypothetical protein
MAKNKPAVHAAHALDGSKHQARQRAANDEYDNVAPPLLRFTPLPLSVELLA